MIGEIPIPPYKLLLKTPAGLRTNPLLRGMMMPTDGARLLKVNLTSQTITGDPQLPLRNRMATGTVTVTMVGPLLLLLLQKPTTVMIGDHLLKSKPLHLPELFRAFTPQGSR
jgi:hypothetical protein